MRPRVVNVRTKQPVETHNTKGRLRPTPITNYTTYDLEYYYADLKWLPSLSRQDRQRLITTLDAGVSSTSPASSAFPPDDPQGRQRLIESYLPLAKHLAIALCPPTLYRRLLPELIGAVNLAVVQALTRSDLGRIDNLNAYVYAYVRAAIKRTLGGDHLLTLPWWVKAQAREAGTLDQLYAQYRVESLDELMQWFDTQEIEEPPVAPPWPTQTAPAGDEEQRAQVETLLSYLSPRAQAILRLRYGLGEDNERAHSSTEIARLLGLSRSLVLTTERDALARLRALVEGKAHLGQRNGRACICYPQAHTTSYRITPQQEAALRHAASRLQAHGVLVSGPALAQAAGVSVGRARLFLRQHPSESATAAAARAPARQQKLEEAYTRLHAQGMPITGPLLAKEADVGKQSASDFLKARRSSSHATS